MTSACLPTCLLTCLPSYPSFCSLLPMFVLPLLTSLLYSVPSLSPFFHLLPLYLPPLFFPCQSWCYNYLLTVPPVFLSSLSLSLPSPPCIFPSYPSFVPHYIFFIVLIPQSYYFSLPTCLPACLPTFSSSFLLLYFLPSFYFLLFLLVIIALQHDIMTASCLPACPSTLSPTLNLFFIYTFLVPLPFPSHHHCVAA